MNVTDGNTEGIIERKNFVVLSGCSGGGKSTLLAELARRGFKTVAETGRQIVKDQLATGGRGLPWVDLNQFLELALSKNTFNYTSTASDQGYVFFDRSIIDTVQNNGSQSTRFRETALKFRYHHTVFLVPPWQEIYQVDAERKHTFEDGVKEYEELLKKYDEFNYHIEIIPKLSISQRADWLLEKLHY